MTPTTSPTPPVIPDDVRDFVAANKATKYLDDILAMTHEVFPAADVSLVLEDDPEIPFESYVWVTVRATFDSSDARDDAWDRWRAEKVRIWPDWEARILNLWIEA